MRTNATTLRLRQYAPLGNPGGIVPDLGITLVSGPDGGTLQATIATSIANGLPDDCEVAVEVYDEIAGQWVEGNDSRFVLLTTDADDRDPTGAVTLAGVSLPVWLATKAALASQVPYSDSGTVEAVMVGTGISVSGTVFTWAGHSLVNSDRVRITDSGKSKGLSKGAVYFVRGASGSTFSVSHTATGAIMSFGSSHSIKMERVRTRITNLAGHQFTKNMAISVWNANANEPVTNGSQYYVVNPLSSSIQIATKPGGMPVEFTSVDNLTVYRYIDGQRVWKNATPGNVISTAFMEARDRGWGQDGSGNDQVFHSWTVAADSNSLVWPARVDDPSVAGVSVGFQPGTSLWAMIQFLTANGWAEFASQGRTFNLYAPNTGNDYSTGRTPKRVGVGAQQVQIHKDLTDYRTTEIVRGEGPIEQVVKGARSPWGVLEVYATASGVTTASHAKSYGTADITQYSKPQTGYTATEPVAASEVVPILDYQRGDWVQVLVKGVPTRLRVTQWTLTKAADGTMSISTLMEYRKRSVLSKVAHAAKKANGGRMVTTTSTTPPEIDKRKAAQPASLTVAARPTYAADKSARATVTASWLPVTSDTEGDDLAGQQYEVVLRANGEQEGKVVAVTKNTSADLPALPAGQTVAVSVRAISSTGEAGELTDEIEYVVDLPVSPPDAPSTPTVTSTLGSIVVAWDGNLLDAIDGPHLPTADDALAYVTVQRSTDGTTWVTEAQTLAAAGTVTDLGLTVGTTYQYRLQAVSTTGAVSTYSATASAAVVAVNTAQINAAFTQSVTDAANAASNAQTVANSANTAAGNALTAANGKNRNTYSTSAAASGTPGLVAGDEWFQIDGSGNVTAQWQWSGTAWVTANLTGAVITTLDAAKITTGTLSAARIAAGSLAVTQLAVTDLTNLYPDPAFGLTFNTQGALSFPYAGTPAAPKGTAWVIADRDNIGARGQMSVKPGDAFYVEADVRLIQGAATLTAGLWVGTASNGSDPNFAPYGTLNTVEGSGTVFDYGNGWTRRWWRFTIPTTATQVDHGTPYFQVNQTAGQAYSAATAYALGNLVIRRLNSGNLIVDGSISATKIAATAIDAMTITGATFRTASTAKTSGGVQIDSTGLHGYNASGVATFSLTTAGALTVTGANVSGTITATGGSITGNISVSGTLSLGSAGSITTTSGTYTTSIAAGQVYLSDSASGSTTQSYLTPAGLVANPNGMGTQYMLQASIGDTQGAKFGSYNGVVMYAGKDLTLSSGSSGTGTTYSTAIYGGPGGTGATSADLNLTADGSGPRIWSNAILNRTYPQASTNGTSSSNLLVCITTAGTLGVTNNGIFFPDVYTRVRSTRAVMIQSDGSMGTTASTRRVKNLHRHLKMDDKVLDAWLALPTWEYEYKAEIGIEGVQHGLVAEEVHDAGFTNLVYYDERPVEQGGTPGQVDGFAYERMGVYNRMALQRLYARLMQAEKQIEALTRKAA